MPTTIMPQTTMTVLTMVPMTATMVLQSLIAQLKRSRQIWIKVSPPLPSTDSDSEPQSGGTCLQQKVDTEPPLDMCTWLHDMNPNVDELKTAIRVMKALQNASLDNGDLDAGSLSQLHSPPQCTFPICDPSELLSLRQFLATQR
jgi:hypothetical protein